MGNFSNYWDLHTLFTKIKNKLKSISDKIDDSVSLKTATGNPIVITDAANANAEELSMTIEPIQDLHGYSKPWPAGGGKNLLQCSFTDGSSSGMAWTANKDSAGNVASVTLNGTYSASSRYFLKLTDVYLEAGSYYLSGAYNAYAALEVYGNGISVVNDNSSVSTLLTIPMTGTYAVYIAIANNQQLSNVKLYPMIRKASETDADFAPYSNICPITGLTSGEVQTTNGTDTNTATITFGQTVYGGSVNFKTGEVTVTHKLTTVGALSWATQVSAYANFYTSSLTSEVKKTDEEAVIKSDIYVSVSNRQPSGPTENGTYVNSDGQIKVNDRRYSTVEDWLAVCSSAQICYELETPITLTLTSAELELLKGNNTITANGAEISIEYYPDNAIGALAERVDDKADKSDVAAALAEKVEIQNNAGFHNSIYRGKFLGTEVTQEQWDAIAAGTFDDMFTGDFWTIGGVNYRIGHFNYWLGTGDTKCTLPHVLIVPDTNLYTAKMNDSNVTTGAYVGSKMYTTNLAQAKTTINNAFGASHILNHREYLANAMKATADPTYESAGSWYDSTVELMNERMVYGADVFHNVEVNGAIPANHTIDKSQLVLFALDPSRIYNREAWWLRCAVSAASFAIVHSYGGAASSNASYAFGVRPAFGIKA